MSMYGEEEKTGYFKVQDVKCRKRRFRCVWGAGETLTVFGGDNNTVEHKLNVTPGQVRVDVFVSHLSLSLYYKNQL